MFLIWCIRLIQFDVISFSIITYQNLKKKKLKINIFIFILKLIIKNIEEKNRIKQSNHTSPKLELKHTSSDQLGSSEISRVLYQCNYPHPYLHICFYHSFFFFLIFLTFFSMVEIKSCFFLLLIIVIESYYIWCNTLSVGPDLNPIFLSINFFSFYFLSCIFYVRE